MGTSIRKNLVAFHQDLLSVGPISTILYPEEHIEWLSANAKGLRQYAFLSDDECEQHFDRLSKSFEKIRTWNGDITVWYSSRSASEMSFFLAFTQKFDRALDTDFIDVAALSLDGKPLSSTGECDATMPPHAALSAYQMNQTKFKSIESQFKSLDKTSNGIRVFEDGTLSEAKLDVHDLGFEQCFDTEWTSWQKIVRKLHYHQRQRGVHEVDYSFMHWRTDILQQQGRIVCRDKDTKVLLSEGSYKSEWRLSSSN